MVSHCRDRVLSSWMDGLSSTFYNTTNGMPESGVDRAPVLGHRAVHLRLLLLLLLGAQRHGGLDADQLLLRLHGVCVPRLLHHAGHHRLARLTPLHPPHLPCYQMRVILQQLCKLAHNVEAGGASLLVTRHIYRAINCE